MPMAWAISISGKANSDLGIGFGFSTHNLHSNGTPDNQIDTTKGLNTLTGITVFNKIPSTVNKEWN